jgi:excisionase family DNA binding protein
MSDVKKLNLVDGTGQEAGKRLGLRPKEAARALGIGERLLWELTNRGEIPHARLGRCVVYPVTELEKWLAAQAGGVTCDDSLEGEHAQGRPQGVGGG